MLDGIRAADDDLARALDRQNREGTEHDEVRGIALLVGVCAATRGAELGGVRAHRAARCGGATGRSRSPNGCRTPARRTKRAPILTGHLEELVAGGDGRGDRARTTGRRPARPIVARGERIGSVVLRSDRDLRDSTERWVHDSILRAAPVLATLRTLAAAQARAATDPLTGLGQPTPGRGRAQPAPPRRPARTGERVRGGE